MRKRKVGLLLLLILASAGAGFVTARAQWGSLFSPAISALDESKTLAHDHVHVDAVSSLVLSDAAKASLGLELSPIELQDYWRSIPIAAEVMEEPGHCEQGVSATVQGIVLKIHAFHGQTVRSGDPLFTLRPTSELLASTQSALLKSVQEIELVQAELKRIEPITESGAIPQAKKIEKESELKRLNSQRLLHIQELLVRGLSPDQISEIVTTKALIQELTIRAPRGDTPTELDKLHDETDVDRNVPDSLIHSNKISNHEHTSVYSIEQLNVHLGKLIQPGEEMCHLARHSQLLIVGRAFERESFLINGVIENNWPVKAIFEVTDKSPVVRDGLSILYTDNVVEPNSRILRFYIPLPNELVRDQPSVNGLSYRSWKFKPGQRATVLLPVEHLLRQIVIPAEAVVKEGTEAFVFRANGKRLERVPVRLQHLDSREALIKAGSKIAAGDIIARNQAFQLHLALKNARDGHEATHEGHDHAGHEH